MNALAEHGDLQREEQHSPRLSRVGRPRTAVALFGATSIFFSPELAVQENVPWEQTVRLVSLPDAPFAWHRRCTRC